MIKRVDENGLVHLVTNIRKPRKWRRYEYLLSSGTLWINTGIALSLTDKFEFETDFIYSPANGRAHPFYGTASYTTGFMALYHYTNNSLFPLWIKNKSYGGGSIAVNAESRMYSKTIIDVPNKAWAWEYNSTSASGTYSDLITDTTSTVKFFGNDLYNKYITKCYYFRIKRNDLLIRDFVPAEYNGLYGMWDLVEDKFYGNSGTGTFTVGPEIKNYDEVYEVRKTSSLLPAGVELYDSLRFSSSSNTYIETNLTPTNTTEYRLSFKPYSTTWAIFGASTTASNGVRLFYSGHLYAGFGGYRSEPTTTITANTTHIVTYKKTQLIIDSTTYSVGLGTSFPTTLSIGRDLTWESGVHGLNGELNYFQIYDNNTLIRNFLPCTYLGEPGMWDTVENKFYRNQGTGLFTLGNKIILKEYEYLESSGTLHIDSGYKTSSLIVAYKWGAIDINTNSSNSLFGSESASSPKYSGILYGGRTSRSLYIGSSASLEINYNSDNNKHDWELNINLGTVSLHKDSNLIKSLSYSGQLQNTVSIGIFCNNGMNLISKLSLYYFLIYDNDVLVRNFIPVSYNGTPGLWDKVEWKFYGNVGSGSFALGPEKASGIYPVTEASAYGVLWTENLSSTTLLRIGSHNLHRELPILSQFKGCVVNPTTKLVVYWLDENDWSKKADGTSSILDGTDGLVMVHIPRFWGKSGKTGTTCWVKISPKYIDSTWQEIPEMFVGAYRATVSNSKAYSVVNTTAAFRGGNNRSAYDTYLNSDPFRSDLGKPRTKLSRANMRTYCRNNNMEMLNYEYYKWIFYWCYVIEYANFNCLATFNSMLTNDGFRLGGLGSGVTTWSNTATSWSGYNATYPITPNGYCNNIGNGTGTKELTIPLTVNGSNTIESKTFYVPRWRGFDNPFGDTWTNLDGCNVQGDSEGNPKNVYTTTDPTKYADGTTSNMTLAGHIIHSAGYVKEFDLGTTGNIFAASVGGTATTYKCDYNYPGSASTSFRWLLVGGSVIDGGKAGLGFLGSDRGVGAANSAVGFRPIVVI